MFRKHLWLAAVVALAWFNLGQDGDSCWTADFRILPSTLTIDPRAREMNLSYTLSVYGYDGTLSMQHTCSACCSVSLSNSEITVKLVNEVPKGTQCVITVTDQVPLPAVTLTTSAAITVLQQPLEGTVRNEDAGEVWAKPARPATSLVVGESRKLYVNNGMPPLTAKIISGNSVSLVPSALLGGIFTIQAVSPGDAVVVVCDAGIPADCVSYTYRVKAK